MMFFLGCHLVDLIYQIQGRPKNVIPLNKTTGIDGAVGKDFGMAVLDYGNGVSFAKASACEVGGYLRRQLVVSGSKGTVELKPFEVPVPKTEIAEKDESCAFTGKKILYAASSMEHIKSFHLEYIDRLRKAGNVVLVMARGLDADFNVPFRKQFFSKKNAEARKKIREIVLAEHFDVIITHTTLASFHIRLAVSRRERPRIVNMVHGYLFSQNSSLIKRTVLLLCEKLVKKKTDAIIVMNKDDMRIAKRNRLSSGKVYYCRGLGVKPKLPQRTPKEVREELNSQNNYNLAFAGELSARKNQKYLVSSMPRIKEFIPHARLWLIGDGDKRKELEDLAKELGVENDVLFLGKRENVADYVNAADIYVSASKSEGLPFNIVEALMLGKTVLATRCKGQEDIIVSNKSGYLFELDKSDEYAENVKLIHDGIKKLDENEIKDRGMKFSYGEVFEETLQIVMEAASESSDFRHIK
jgi:glycosyltransferase EpsD